jgi:hypothetical protein
MDHVTLLLIDCWCHPTPTSVIIFIGDNLNVRMECIKHTGFFSCQIRHGGAKLCEAIQ